MSILQEARDSVALDRDPRLQTCSALSRALEWLVGWAYEVQQGRDTLGAIYCQALHRTRRAHRVLGFTVAEAIIACAREAGWGG